MARLEFVLAARALDQDRGESGQEGVDIRLPRPDTDTRPHRRTGHPEAFEERMRAEFTVPHADPPLRREHHGDQATVEPGHAEADHADGIAEVGKDAVRAHTGQGVKPLDQSGAQQIFVRGPRDWVEGVEFLQGTGQGGDAEHVG